MLAISSLKKAVTFALGGLLLSKTGGAYPTNMDSPTPPADVLTFDPTADVFANLTTRAPFSGPVFPQPGQLKKITDPSSAQNPFFPLGQAPISQQPCTINVHQVGKWWSEGLKARRRITFNVPRKDIPHDLVAVAATSAWFNDLAQQLDLADRCGCKSKNFQIWFDEKDKQWLIDFNEWPGRNGDNRASCQLWHFIKVWGQWTGCTYPMNGLKTLPPILVTTQSKNEPVRGDPMETTNDYLNRDPGYPTV